MEEESRKNFNEKIWNNIIYNTNPGVSTIFEIVLSALGIIALWRWGDWKNFEKYYPTLLYATLGNFIYKVIALFQFHLWEQLAVSY